MKKITQMVLVAGFVSVFSTSLAAYSPTSIFSEKVRQEEINKAYEQRFTNLYRVSSNSAGGKSYTEKRASLFKKLLKNNTSSGRASVVRKGEFHSSDTYKKRRSFSVGNYYRQNYNQVSKARAIDYYLKGGTAGTEILKSGVLLGSTHQVSRNGSASSGRTASNKDILSIRRAQKKFSNLASNNAVKYRPFSNPRRISVWENPYLKKLSIFDN